MGRAQINSRNAPKLRRSTLAIRRVGDWPMAGVSALRRSIAREEAPLSFSMLIAFSKWLDHPTRSSMALKCQSGPCRLFQHVHRVFTRGGFASGTEQPHEFARHDAPRQYQGRDAERRST